VVLSLEERKLKPRRDWILSELRETDQSLGSPESRVLHILGRAGASPRRAGEIATEAVLPRSRVLSILSGLSDRAATVFRGEKWIDRQVLEEIRGKILTALDAYHDRHPMRAGQSRVALRDALGLDRRLFDEILDAMADEGRVVLHGNLVAGAGRAPRLDDAAREAAEEIGRRFREGGFSPPDPRTAGEDLAVGEETAAEVMRHLRETGELVDIGKGLLFHRDILAKAEGLIRDRIAEKGELVSAEFRDLVGTTRKYAIPLLEHFDAVGLTLRLDNIRVLREHGGRKGSP
jgi:selenocysteine-specific elongation factor